MFLLNRRSLLFSTAGAFVAASRGRHSFAGSQMAAALKLDDAVIIRALDLLRVDGERFVRVTAADGSVGYAVTNQHAVYLQEMFRQRVAPAFVGKDARNVEALLDDVYLRNNNYKLVGVPFWCCVSWAELAVLDLLGRRTQKPVAALLGEGQPLKTHIPMYLSSTDRESTPEQEVAMFEEGLQKTGAKAVKFKIGGRMRAEADIGRTETLVSLMRKRLGDDITLYADANGSYDVKQAIAVGRRLEANGVAIFEEPCPFEDYAATRLVTKALKRLQVAGGEQDTSWYRFNEIVKSRVVDVVQPDVSYNGGLLRTARVAKLAASAGLRMGPHCPQASTMLYTTHLAASVANMTPYQEFHVSLVDRPPWFAPGLRLQAGNLSVCTQPGLGLQMDPDRVARATLA
ncbi:MAG: mandelate racemase/muconate lactonizing enzyme family protein [Deltaproteobacteria bacterium]|nr:mandelate racemase/muconate lactonizing enzyme family protein [Deltaproteobacteria bacterium]